MWKSIDSYLHFKKPEFSTAEHVQFECFHVLHKEICGERGRIYWWHASWVLLRSAVTKVSSAIRIKSNEI